MARKKGFKRERQPGVWEIVIDWGRNAAGKRRQHSETVRGTADDADRRLDELILQIEREEFAKPAKITFGQWLWQWFDEYVVPNLEPRTVSSYKSEIKNHIARKLGAVNLSKLTPRHLREFYAKALIDGKLDGSGGLDARTVHYHHRIISEALKHAVEAGYLVRNVAEAVRPPRVRRKQISVLAPSYIPPFLKVIRENMYYVLFYTDFSTGLRLAEICALHWDRVDLARSFISVDQVLLKRSGVLEFRIPKSPHSRRRITIPASLVRLLREHRRAQEEIGNMLNRPLRETDLVFSHPVNVPLDPSTVSHNFSRAMKKSGLPYINFHGMRHTHATMLLAAGVNPKVVSERLGHASVAFTLDTYAHVLPTMQSDAAEKFDAMIFSELVKDQEVGDVPGQEPEVNVGKMLENGGTDLSKKVEFESEPPETRTRNLLIKSQLLCQLS